MIGLHWYPERRARYEKQLLEAYLAELYQHDIRYSFAELWYDYRLHLAKQLLTPIAQSQIGVPALVWRPHLDRAFATFEELNCAEFLA
ncbi:MAG: hypothetical protein ACI82A_004281 [Candidatus Azotimanducaceae bacterium]|jgi:hypothetical protein